MERLKVLVLTGFPIPPSTNKLYAFVKNRLIKTRDYRAYERAVYQWLTINQYQIVVLRAFTKDLGDYVFSIDALFHMEQKSILCLNGKPKKNDTSNRLKALHDVLSSIVIGVDDSYFWSCSADKCVVPNGEPTYVDITLKLRTIENQL